MQSFSSNNIVSSSQWMLFSCSLWGPWCGVRWLWRTKGQSTDCQVAEGACSMSGVVTIAIPGARETFTKNAWLVGKKGLSPRKQWLSSSLTFSMQHECFCWSTRRTCRAQGCWLLSCRRPSLMKRQEMWGKLRSALLLKRPFQNRRCWVSQSLRGPMAQWDTWAPWELQFCLDNSGCSKTGGWTSGRERWSAGAADFGRWQGWLGK